LLFVIRSLSGILDIGRPLPLLRCGFCISELGIPPVFLLPQFSPSTLSTPFVAGTGPGTFPCSSIRFLARATPLVSNLRISAPFFAVLFSFFTSFLAPVCSPGFCKFSPLFDFAVEAAVFCSVFFVFPGPFGHLEAFRELHPFIPFISVFFFYVFLRFLLFPGVCPFFPRFLFCVPVIDLGPSILCFRPCRSLPLHDAMVVHSPCPSHHPAPRAGPPPHPPFVGFFTSFSLFFSFTT